MKWEDVCKAFPNKWVLIEVVQAYTNDENERVLEKVTPLNKYLTSTEAMNAYQQIHQENPQKELYVLHTSRKEPNIMEKKWVGVRR